MKEIQYRYGIDTVSDEKEYGIDTVSDEGGYPMDTTVSVSVSDTVSVSVNNSDTNLHKKQTKFIKPTLDEIQNYCNEKNYSIDANQFIDYYESNGWKVGKNSMKDWKAAIRTWSRNNYGKKNTSTNSNNPDKILEENRAYMEQQKAILYAKYGGTEYDDRGIH